jgi:hypothetical protein
MEIPGFGYLTCGARRPGEQGGPSFLITSDAYSFVGGRSGAPALVYAIRPQVVVVNNSTTAREKPRAHRIYTKKLASIQGIEGIWQGISLWRSRSNTIPAKT